MKDWEAILLTGTFLGGFFEWVVPLLKKNIWYYFLGLF
jgi:hypothetical protein